VYITKDESKFGLSHNYTFQRTIMIKCQKIDTFDIVERTPIFCLLLIFYRQFMKETLLYLVNKKIVISTLDVTNVE